MKIIAWGASALAFILVLGASAGALSPERNPYQGRISGRLFSPKNGGNLGLISLETLEGLHKFKITEESTARLRGEEDFGDTARFFNGVSVRAPLGSTLPSGLAVTLSGNELSFAFQGRRSRKNFISTGRINIDSSGRFSGVATVHRYPARSRGSCGTAEAMIDPHALTGSARLSNIGSTSGVITLSIDADYDYYRYRARRSSRRKQNMNKVRDDIRTVINGAEAIYLKQLGFKFRIVSLKIDSENSRPYRSNVSEKLLGQFRKYVLKHKLLSPADEYHLFTGKLLDESVVGLAFVGSVCRSTSSGSYAFSLSSRTSRGLDPLVVAHEFGHTLGATHIDGARSLMSPVLGEENDRFIAASLREIDYYISQYGNCF